MKAINIFLVILAILLLWLAGALALWLSLDAEAGAGLLRALTQLEAALAASGTLRAGLGVVGVLGLLAGAAVVWGNVATRRWERIVVLRNSLGEVHLSLRALEDLGRVVKNDVPGLRDIKLRVSANRRGIQARARVILLADDDLGALTESVQAAIRRRLQQAVGVEQDIRPRIIVGKVVPRSEDEGLSGRPRLRRAPRP
jgi:hypothetical protein